MGLHEVLQGKVLNVKVFFESKLTGFKSIVKQRCEVIFKVNVFHMNFIFQTCITSYNFKQSVIFPSFSQVSLKLKLDSYLDNKRQNQTRLNGFSQMDHKNVIT